MNANFVGGDLVIDLCHSIDLALNSFLVEWIEEEFDVFLSVEGNSGCFASDGCWVALFNNN